MADEGAGEVPALRVDNDRQLFVDDTVIERLEGGQIRMHEPVAREVVMYFDRPWEGQASWCPVVLKDGDLYRMWYRSENLRDPDRGVEGHFFTGYAESGDGIHWERPSLGIFEFDGSKDNNICIDNSDLKNVAVFRDERPGVSDAERYKAVGRWSSGRPSRIFGMVSPDGIHWQMAQDEALIIAPEEDPQFDSPLSSFWDARQERYAIYVRGWRPDGPERRIRAIRMTTSEDFIHWTPWRYIQIAGEAQWRYHLYTNACHPYYRAPFYLMFPKRFLPERKFLEKWPHDGLSDVIFLAGRDGLNFSRSGRDAFLRPGLDRENWHERSIFVGPRAVKTGEGEMSLYSVQHFRSDSIHIRRFTLREDGFVSVRAPSEGGSLVTRPLVFEGKGLEINYSTSAAGSIRVALLGDAGEAIPEFSAEACEEIYGDEIERTVRWNQRSDVSAMAGRPVRVQFEMKEADLFSFRFTEG